MDTFDAYVSAPVVGTYLVQDTPTYLLARDEDCENAFHSTADFVSQFHHFVLFCSILFICINYLFSLRF